MTNNDVILRIASTLIGEKAATVPSITDENDQLYQKWNGQVARNRRQEGENIQLFDIHCPWMWTRDDTISYAVVLEAVRNDFHLPG